MGHPNGEDDFARHCMQAKNGRIWRYKKDFTQMNDGEAIKALNKEVMKLREQNEELKKSNAVLKNQYITKTAYIKHLEQEIICN